MTFSGPPRDVVILGSTGSIGTQALDIIRRNPDRFRVAALAAGGGNLDLLARQAVEFGAAAVAVATPAAAAQLQAALRALVDLGRTERGASPATPEPLAGQDATPIPPGVMPDVLAGPDAVCEVAAWPADVVLNGVTGAAGLQATLAALDAGRTLALANKESLIIGGPLVTSRAKPGQIVPVDSEHSTIAQCLRAGRGSEVRRLVLTASGGPFRGWRRDALADVTPEQALAHPTWKMGPLVTVNSATLVNKGLEVIEAHLLFGFGLDRIDVVVHPQSIVHSMVEFADGATVIMASPPDMRLPISLSLGWPDRVPDAAPGLDWSAAAAWTFEPLDDTAFPAVALAREAAAAGGTMPAVYNAANEACVAAFLSGSIGFTRIVDTVARILSEHDAARAAVTTVADVLAVDAWARRRAAELMNASYERDDRMDLIGWVIFIVALLVSVMLHETGHFVLAKKFGMKVTRYFVGFGPTIWSTWRRRDRVRDQGDSARRVRQDRRHALAGRSRRPGGRGPGVPQQPGLAADPGPVRRLGHALHPRPAAGLRAGPGRRHRRLHHPTGHGQHVRAGQPHRLRQQLLQGVAPALPGPAGRSAGGRHGDGLRRPCR